MAAYAVRVARAWPPVEWADFDVLDESGAVVGSVLEDHEWDGMDYGPATYTVAHNPGRLPGGCVWRSEGYVSVPAAVAALDERLAEVGAS